MPSPKHLEADYSKSDDQLSIGDEPQHTEHQQDTTAVNESTVVPGSEKSASPMAVRRLYDEAEYDRRAKNHPMTTGQNRLDVGGTLLTGSDIEKPEIDAARRIVAKSAPSGRRKLPTIGDGIQVEGPAEDLQLPRSPRISETPEDRAAREQAMRDFPPRAA